MGDKWIILLVSVNLYSQVNLNKDRQKQDQIIKEIMDLSNRNWTEMGKLLKN